MRRITAALSLLALLLAACAPVSTPGPDADSRVQPTQPPPPWVESAEPITLDNVQSIRYLGRLDQPFTPSTVFAYAVSPDSTRLVGLNNDQVLIWDLVTGAQLINTARGDGTQIFFSPDKTEFYTLDPAGVVGVFNAVSGASQNQFQAKTDFNGITAFDENLGWLAVGGTDGEVKVWDMYERRSLVSLDAHRLQISALTFSRDGTRLASAGDEGVVRIWDWQTRTPLLDITLEDEVRIPARLAFSPDASHIAIGTNENIYLYTVPAGELEHQLDITTGAISSLMLYSPDGRYLFNAGQVEDMSIWNTETGTLAATLPDVSGDRVSASFSPDGTMLLTAALNGPVTLWNMSGITETTIPRADLNTSTDEILMADWTEDSRLLLLFDASGPVHLWGIGAPSEATAEA